MDTNKLLPPFPNGWFVVALSTELPPGKLLSRPFMGQDLIIFRTRSGVVSAFDPYCPHLGAHFGYGGTVEGDVLRCPFHGFCFDPQGNCVATGYGTRPPPKAKVRVWPLQEKHGFILVYHDSEGKAPDWEVPELDTEGWSPFLWKVFSLRAHPQEIAENSVDIGHFSVLHKYDAVERLSDCVTDGPHLYARYALRRGTGFLGRFFSEGDVTLRTEADVHVYGLGYGLSAIQVPVYGLSTRMFTLATPADSERVTLRLAVSIKAGAKLKQRHRPLRLVPQTILNQIISKLSFSGFVHDMSDDLEIWENKLYSQPPALAEGDGPIGKYRSWARQFYTQPVEAPV